MRHQPRTLIIEIYTNELEKTLKRERQNSADHDARQTSYLNT